MARPERNEEECRSPLLSFRQVLALTLGLSVPDTPKERERQHRYLLFRHLVVLAIAGVVLMWAIGAGIWGITSPVALLLAGGYFCVVLVWTCRGSRLAAYYSLVGIACSIVSVLGSYLLCRELGAPGKWDVAVVWLTGYLLAIMALTLRVVIWLRRRRLTGFLARPVDWEKGTYDLGRWAAFFRYADWGMPEESELLDEEDRAGLEKRGGLIGLLLFLAPIALALTVTHDDVIDGPVGVYVMSVLMGAGAVTMWALCVWFLLWEREQGRPMLVKQFVDRYSEQR